jgi:hypothetical protein
VWKRTEVHVAHCLVGKPEGSRQFGRLRRRCETNNKMDLTEIEREGIFWISMAHGSVGWLSSTRKRISWFYTMLGISFLAQKPAV